jgi:hypothetical protein
MQILQILVHLPFATTEQSAFALFFNAALLYVLVFYPRTRTGFYSWGPLKRAFVILFFPLLGASYLFKGMSQRNDDDFILMD